MPSVQKSDGCYNGDQTNKIGVQAGALSWREGAGSCILPLPSSSHPLSENMDCLFSPLADELLLKVLEDAGPHAGLRGCNKEFAMLGKDENLWKSFCTRNGVRNDSKFTSWSEAYKSAVQCRHDRGANRDLRYPAATEPSEHAHMWWSNDHHPPLQMTCSCGRCGSTFDVVVEPHVDPFANGLLSKMSKITFNNRMGSRWSEMWYAVGDSLYSLRGGEGLELEEAPTSVKYETSTLSFCGLAKC